MNSGIFTISLDFELHWGVMPRLTEEEYRPNLQGSRKGIEKTLQLFKNHEIHATWATVGFLFYENLNNVLADIPSEQPRYQNRKYNPYTLLHSLAKNNPTSENHLAIKEIKQIAQDPNQEISTHTFSHYFCLEKGQGIVEFRADLKAAINTAEAHKIKIKSIVFPRNQFNKDYLKVCEELGVKYVRGNDQSYIYKARRREDENLLVRLCRFIDSYINLTGYRIFSLPIYENGVVNIPASRFLRPFNKKLSFLEGMRLQRIKKEMTKAAQTNKLYHLWWHPHNFGTNTEKNIQFLKEILDHFKNLQKLYQFRSLNMKEVGEEYE